MPSFDYRAFDSAGSPARGTVEAPSERAARETLVRRGLFPEELRPARGTRVRRRAKVGRADLALALRQLAAMVRAGMPLAQALRALADQVEDPGLRAIVHSLHESVSRGESLGSAAAAFPDVFPREIVGLLRAGERAAVLPTVLDRAAEGLESSARLADRVRTAMLYPAILLGFGAVVFTFLLTFVAPRIFGLFTELGRELPWPTRVVAALSRLAASAWLPGLLLLAAGVLWFRRWASRPAAREKIDRLKLRIPLAGRLLSDAESARYARTLASLLSGGVRMAEALEIARSSVGNRALAARLEGVSGRVRSGIPLSRALEESGALPPVIHHLARAGEASGEVSSLLAHGSDLLETVIEARTERMSTILETGMIIVMGIVFLFVALAILLPLFELNRLPL